MLKSTKVSVELYKYPYSARLSETEDYFSQKIRRSIRKGRKKLLSALFYGKLIFVLSSGIAPSQAVGLAILRP